MSPHLYSALLFQLFCLPILPGRSLRFFALWTVYCTSQYPLSARLTSARPTGLFTLSELAMKMPPSLFLSPMPSTSLHLQTKLSISHPASSTTLLLTSAQLCLIPHSRFASSFAVLNHPCSVARLATLLTLPLVCHQLCCTFSSTTEFKTPPHQGTLSLRSFQFARLSSHRFYSLGPYRCALLLRLLTTKSVTVPGNASGRRTRKCV